MPKAKENSEPNALFYFIQFMLRFKDLIRLNGMKQRKKQKVKTIGWLDAGKEELYACIQRDT